MRARNRLALPLLAISAVAVALGGCASDPISGQVMYTDATNYGDGVTFGDGAGVDGGEPSDDVAAADHVGGDGEEQPLGSELRFGMPNGNADDFGGLCESMCAVKVNQNGVRKLIVQYLINGVPQPFVAVQFAPTDPNSTIAEILAETVFTDSEGRATTEVKSGSDLGVFGVDASVPDDAQAGTRHFELHVLSKAKGPLQVILHYKGVKDPSSFQEIKVRLTLQKDVGKPACGDIDWGMQLPQATIESPPALKWDQPWTLDFPVLASIVQQAGGEAQLTVLGVAATKPYGAIKAGGCSDQGAGVKWNAVTQVLEGDTVEIDVFDVPPRLEGIYDLTIHLDLLSVLPDNVEFVLKTVFDILTDPVGGILALACKLGNGSLDSFCGYIFEDPSNPSIKALAQPIGAIVVKFIDAILLSLLPESVQQGLGAGADLGEILTNMEIGGELEFKKEPDQSGYLAAEFTRQSWQTITYKWSLGQSCNPNDPNCGKASFGIGAVAGYETETIVGHFEAWRDSLKSELTIGLHGLNVKWGAIINHVVQKVLLPMLTDPKKESPVPIDSYEKLIKSLLAGKQCLLKDTCCDEFGASLASQQGLLKADFLASTCELLITLGTAMLEAQIVSLDADTGDPATKSGLLLESKNCPLFDINQENGLVDSVGAKSQPCLWDMTITVGGKPQPIQSNFYATRQD